MSNLIEDLGGYVHKNPPDQNPNILQGGTISGQQIPNLRGVSDQLFSPNQNALT